MNKEEIISIVKNMLRMNVMMTQQVMIGAIFKESITMLC